MTALDTGTRPTVPAATPRGPRLLSQPPAVWAIAFAAMVAFMGIGLVGPILPTVAAALQATPVQTSLLFTSYLTVTASAMFFTSWLSTRIGTRAVMILGLAVIALAAIGCALSPSIGALIGFRAVWGLGNALFLSTALASIVSASGGRSEHAVIFYEAALGIGLAVGPLLGDYLDRASLETADGVTVATMHVADEYSLRRLVAKRGGDVEVLEPLAARQAAAEWADAGLSQYR